jgi:hypothetical protein
VRVYLFQTVTGMVQLERGRNQDKIKVQRLMTHVNVVYISVYIDDLREGNSGMIANGHN